MSLYIDNTGSITSANPNGIYAPGNGLDYHDLVPNQQVRVDLMNPAAPLTAVNPDAPGNPGVLLSVYATNANTAALVHYFTITVPSSQLLQFAGRPGGVRLRIAAVNNSGKLIVGVDNVHLLATYTDTSTPGLLNVKLRNPNFGVSGASGGSTSDPTIIGQIVNDQSLLSSLTSANNISFIAFDIANDGNFNGPNAFRITKNSRWDSLGNFTVTLTNFFPNLLPATYTVGIEVVDKAGNAFTVPFTFTYGGPSTSAWSAEGPGPISTAGQGVQFPNIAGKVTAEVVDPRDPSGNTLLVGSANGGVWRSNNGGNDWTPLTDHVTDASGNPVAVPVGGLALGVNPAANTSAIYVGLGVADLAPDSTSGTGILKSTDNGLTWQLLGTSTFAGARISKVLVDPTNLNIVYVAVAGGGSGPGVYRSADGGVTWTDILTTASLGGLPVPSATDLVINAFNPEDLTVGLGNIGLVPTSPAAGVWITGNHGGNWTNLKGGTDPRVLNDTLPSGVTVGRVTLAQGSTRVTDQNDIYVLVATPPPAAVRGVIDYGTAFGSNQQGYNSPGSKGIYGLYKTKDGGANWTHVMLRENIPIATSLENYVDINLMGHDAANAGALLVDPANPNIVMVGGSGSFAHPGDALSHPLHSLLFVDTSNMRDTTYQDPLHPLDPANIALIPNDGDDMDKGFGAELAALPKTQGGLGLKGKEYTVDNKPYEGEGVFWFDLMQDVNNSSTGISLLPDSIHALAFDSQGRLLVGTSGGVYRTSALSFNYDFASGTPLSIMSEDFGINSPTEPSVSFTSLNGNLQIADLTGVAIDPQSSKTLYISGMNMGTATGTGSGFGTFNWTSSALTALNATIIPHSGYPPIINAGSIWAALPPPGSSPGTPTTVYQTWQFADPQSALEVEVSTQGGLPGTFTTQNTGIANLKDNAAMFPPLVLNANNQQELMYGTSTIYEGDTGATHWDNVVSTPTRPTLSSTGGVVTALAFAPSGTDAFYAGTDKGEVFVDLNDGLQGWPNRSAGLPGARVNGIAVDPNNQNIAYVMLGGGGIGHVWKTTNAGVTWTNISAGLPDVPVYSMVVIDGRAPGSTVGNLYLGTQVGVYVLVGQGGTWQRLGQGMPNVPVVDLQYNPTFKILAAATQGRGVLEISTDTTGPQVVAMTPATPILPPLTTINVTFSKAVDPRSFNVGDENTARSLVAGALDHSTEYRTNLIVSYYQRFLLRTPSSNEVSGWLSLMAQGESDEQIIAGFLGSPEYFQNPAKGNNNNTSWVNSIYQDLIGQPPTAAQLSQALTDLNTQSRSNVSYNDLLNTPTYQTFLVTGLYNMDLRRNPSSSELSGWLSTFAANPIGVDEQIITTLVSSVEYYADNGTLTPVSAQPGSQQLVSGAQLSAVALADVNGDGTPDLIVANAGNDTVDIFAGIPGGGFQTKPVVLTLPAGAKPQALVVGNFSGGALPDIAVANSGLTSATANSLSVFQNTNSTPGVVSFGPAVNFDAGNNPVGLTVADFNGDHIPDLAVVDSVPAATKYNIHLFTGTGTAAMLLPSTVLDTGFSSAPTGIAAGDLNGDGIPDLAVSGQGGLSVLVNDAGRVFATTTAQVIAVPVGSTNVGTSSVAIGRVDTSGLNDIVLTTKVGGGKVLVFQNPGGSNPTFAAPTAFNAGAAPTDVTIRDLNGDGLNDIVVVSAASAGSVTVLRNTTVHAATGLDTITFAGSISYPVGNTPVGLALADTNGDAVLDVAAVNSIGGTASVLLGTNTGIFQMPTDSSFVNQAYKDILGRSADVGGLNSFVTQLGQAEQVRLTGPMGSTSPLSITNPSGDYTNWQITFAPQVSDGTYSLIFGPNSLNLTIKDFINGGMPLDQDADGSNGQAANDGFNGPVVINTSDNGHFLSGLYHDLLGRVADTGGFLGFLGPIDSIRSQALNTPATAIVNSSENLGNFIRRLFSTSDPLAVGSYLLPFGNFMHRLASSSDVSYFVQVIQQGGTEEQVMGSLLSSGEYFTTRAGGSNAAWVAAVYQDVLGRGITGDPGAQNFINGLNNGSFSRAQVASILLSSTEYHVRLIQNTYLPLLGRLPASAEVGNWNGFLALPRAAGLSRDQQFVELVLASGENFYRAGNTNVSWLTTLYTRLLGRAPDPNGFNSLAASITSPYQGQRQGIAAAITSSGEYKSRLVSNYYQTYLRRPPTSGELSTQTAALLAGAPDEALVSGLVSTTEYFQNQASGQNAQWIQHIYQDLLFRSSAGDPGAANFLNALNNGSMSRSQVATIIVTSSEYRTDLVARFYNTYLARSFPLPAPMNNPELAGWVNALASGFRDEQVLDIILSSPEYFGLPHQYP
jgi:hypothetical protein